MEIINMIIIGLAIYLSIGMLYLLRMVSLSNKYEKADNDDEELRMIAKNFNNLMEIFRKDKKKLIIALFRTPPVAVKSVTISIVEFFKILIKEIRK
jgi:hypothetical protein